METKILLNLLLVTILVSACSERALPCKTYPALWVNPLTVDVSIGQSICGADDTPTLTFGKVVNDSRCPINARCITAGDMTIALELRQEGNLPSTIELSFSENSEVITFRSNKFRIRFVRASPSRETSKAIDPRDYTVTLEISPL
jgi:hypothetical protein